MFTVPLGRVGLRLAEAGYPGQLTDERLPDDAPSNLFEPVKGHCGAHGRFDARSREASWEMFTDRHRDALYMGAATLLGLFALHRAAKRFGF